MAMIEADFLEVHAALDMAVEAAGRPTSLSLV